jgi:hypothetical protein
MRLRASTLATLACGLAFLGIAFSAAAQSVKIRGTSVTIAVPPGYKVSRGFSGIENAETGSSVTIAELPTEAYAELAALFASPKTASNRFASEGIRITRVEPLEVDGAQIPLVIGDQRLNNSDVAKYFTVMGGPRANAKTVLITFNIVQPDTFSRGDVEAALRSVKIGRIVTVEEKLAQLPFTFKAVAPFHAADALSGSTALLTTFEGTDPSGRKPIISMGRASTSARPAETAETAVLVLRNISGFKDAVVSEERAVAFAGGDGYYISAVAGDSTIVQFLRVLPTGSYMRFMSRGETSAMKDAAAAIQEIAGSVELK